MRQHAKKGFA
jgi:hypothetical protein